MACGVAIFATSQLSGVRLPSTGTGTFTTMKVDCSAGFARRCCPIGATSANTCRICTGSWRRRWRRKVQSWQCGNCDFPVEWLVVQPYARQWIHVRLMNSTTKKQWRTKRARTAVSSTSGRWIGSATKKSARQTPTAHRRSPSSQGAGSS